MNLLRLAFRLKHHSAQTDEVWDSIFSWSAFPLPVTPVTDNSLRYFCFRLDHLCPFAGSLGFIKISFGMFNLKKTKLLSLYNYLPAEIHLALASKLKPHIVFCWGLKYCGCRKYFLNCVDSYCLVLFEFWHNVGANVTLFVFAHVLTQVCGVAFVTKLTIYQIYQINLFILQIWLTFMEDCSSHKQMQMYVHKCPQSWLAVNQHLATVAVFVPTSPPGSLIFLTKFFWLFTSS